MSNFDTTRRIFLKGALSGAAITALLGAGVFTPQQVLAAWPKDAFGANTSADALKALFGAGDIGDSDRITLKAPDIAENGAVVPISIETDLPNVESISIIVENNPSPLAASFELPPEALPDISTRIKMGETSNVMVVVKADGKLYSTHKEVKVTIGGCGG